MNRHLLSLAYPYSQSDFKINKEKQKRGDCP